MLSEVKKEVDIMRILKGHPNIVFLIDAAWHRLANGTYEVFILMEFCPGGGIIDMMNRRLRERLTEAEILTIFVDVCEGLAAMHALKPPILHRDLKVENILQASPTSYKLCDFGSATPVQKVPSNTAELRALETDLNRHTTLQYRAPEMIDVHLRRPIDEKSDVWALGVLLYKLCYYTTPFEEHGPLAILNVQYKIPPYPAYSAQMISLIASMLKEHGAQRPSVFEILQHVHNLRGTKSKFQYSIPAKEPLSPRSLQAPLQALSPNIAANPLDDLVSYRSQQGVPKNAGVEAREKVLEAIAPMRRGRPPQSHPSRPGSPEKPVAFETKFGDDEHAWKGLRPARSGLPSLGAGSASLASKGDADAWSVGSRQSAQKSDSSERRAFDNDFSSGFGSKFSAARSPPLSKPVEGTSSGFGSGFGDAFDPSKVASASASSQSQSQSSSRPSPSPQQPSRYRQSRIGKDAFDGLGLSSQQQQAPTLGQARMSRTGLASYGSSSASSSTPYNLTPPISGGLGTSNTTYRPPSAHASRPTPSPQPSSQPQAQPQSTNMSSITPSSQTWRQTVQPPAASSQSQPQEGMSAEERFPSLEDLDRTFGSPSPGASTTEKPPSRPVERPPSRSSYVGSFGTGNHGLTAPGGVKGRFDGVRSQHVTGTAMRDARAPGSRQSMFLRNVESVQTKTEDGPSKQPLASRPSLSRKHRSSVSVKTASHVQPESADILSGAGTNAPSLPPRPSQGRAEPQDWLTGTDEPMGGSLGTRLTGAGLSQPNAPGAQPVLRESPSKRASYIERSPITLQKPLEAESVPAPQAQIPAQSAVTQLEREWDMALDRLDQIPAGKSERERRERERAREKDSEREKRRSRSKSKSPGAKSTKAFITRNDVNTGGLGLQLPSSGTGSRGAMTARQTATPSPSGLTDNWSPLSSPKRSRAHTGSRSKQGSMSSSGDEEPEDANGFAPKGGAGEKATPKGGMQFGSNGSAMVPPADGQRRRRARSKGRQSSVHDLVDLWGGGLDKSKSPTERAPAPGKRNSVIVPASSSATMKPPPLTNKPRSSSPQPAPPASPSKYAKQTSSTQQASGGSRQLPIPSATPEPPTPTGRSRPASMFIAPISTSRSTPGEMGIPSSSEAAASFAEQALSPPDTPRSRKTTRRSSISDMVQRYEAIGAPKPKGQGPGPPAKPAGLSVKTQHQSKPSNASSDLAVPSPSAAATRFPKLSPTSSPVFTKASLAVPDDAGRSQYGRDFAKHRTSPTGLPPRSSPVGRMETPYSSSYNPSSSSQAHTPSNGLPSRRSPLPLEPPRDQPSRASNASARGDIGMGPPPSPKLERKLSGTASLEAADPNLRSPSPEKPFQGVSKLIDRWQRVADDSTPAGLGAPPGARRGGVPPRRAGMVSGGSGRG
ncbi:hypothetical protein OH76DRAFT_1406613 [Lentinus brumalis]|uniref:non-specific serine/threonine protein kinase n=1 Tax=Lentinus brumalis TaxID=2498619 RepID=A0A371D2I2_9APHY|nr:hypothetical protein OH76DRAFT_1406613 [Polyporus brumalis]